MMHNRGLSIGAISNIIKVITPLPIETNVLRVKAVRSDMYILYPSIPCI